VQHFEVRLHGTLGEIQLTVHDNGVGFDAEAVMMSQGLGLISMRERASLMLCILGIAGAVSAYAELCMMHSVTAAEYGEWLRWLHVPVFLALIAQLLFAHFYLGTGRLWLMWAIIFARSVVLIVNFSVHPNFNFSRPNMARIAGAWLNQLSGHSP